MDEWGLSLTRGQLDDIRAALRTALEDGLSRDGAPVAMLPTYVPPPPDDTAGDAIAFDAGGTSLRAAWMRVEPEGGVTVVREVTAPMPGAAGRPPSTARELFGAHAELAARLGAPPGLPVGYCFSYPARSFPDRDAELVRWTKEVRVDGVVGLRVGRALRDALSDANVATSRVVVINDTIAVLIAGARRARRWSGTVGLIVGTGCNMGAFFDVARIPKLLNGDDGAIAVNFESGAFRPPWLGPADDAVDAESEAPGTQRFEKAVSGAYLGDVLEHAARLSSVSLPSTVRDAADVAALAETGHGAAAALARAVLDRSADLVAAALAAAADVIASSEGLRVAAEGSLVQRAPGYQERLRNRLGDLVGRPVELTVVDGSTLAGAALAALCP